MTTAPPFISEQDLADVTKRTADSDSWVIALDSACQIIRDYLHQTINYIHNDTVQLEGGEFNDFWLPERPVIDVTAASVNWKGLVQEYDSDSLMASRRGLLQIVSFGSGSIDAMLNGWGGNPWGGAGANLSITYSHGYATTEEEVDSSAGILRVPSSIRRVAIGVAERLLSRTNEEAKDEIGYVGTESRVLASEDAFLRTDECQRLNPYRFPAASGSIPIQSA